MFKKLQSKSCFNLSNKILKTSSISMSSKIISMRPFFLFSLFILCFNISFSQISGTVSDSEGNPLPFVNVFIENTYKGTTTNNDGYFEINLPNKKQQIIVFSFLGYKTIKKEVSIKNASTELNITLEEESVSLGEITINSDENPADKIIRAAIKSRKENLSKINDYKANFYSRGLIKIKNAPEKILGQEVGDLGGGLDSTRSGIIYLSETISKIQFLKPDRLKEKIEASKVSGDDNGFSFNNAQDVNYNFYNNTISFGNEIVSPIANNAFGYYKYTLEGTFLDERNNIINKIKVTPKRKNDPVFEGYIYIVEDQWTIYAIELDITGEQSRIPVVDLITLKQNFSYNSDNNIWAKISQSIDFEYKFMGIKGDGRFTAVYSNYQFNSNLTKNDFNKEIVAFAENANKKDIDYWNTIRPVPLSLEEQKDYVKKDSIQTRKNSEVYKDSVDKAQNKFKLDNILGYTYRNSIKNYRFGFNIPISSIQFNTVQGYTAEANVFYTKNFNEYKNYFNASSNFQYGFSDKRLRATGRLYYKFNDINDRSISLSGGVRVEQFNRNQPISGTENTISTLFFEDNYIKLFEKQFVSLNYSEEITNGIYVFSGVSYEKRKGVFNTTDYTLINEDDDIYTSNNPVDPTNFNNAPFENHNIIKANISARFNFGQTYLSYPDSKYNITNDKYPTLILNYEKGFSASIDEYNFDVIRARLYQSFNIGNKGRFNYNLKAGKFFNAENIAFMDYQHFNGNQTHYSSRGNYTNVFNNLGYYNASTNDSYFEAHAEHDFNGFILGKIPGLNKLNFNLVIGAHALSIPDRKPYQEYSIGLDNIGWGKWRFLRVDYLRSYQGGFQSDAIVFGLKFF